MRQKGQSTIEYAIIATLVILGIITLGPYVFRSVNAHFKLWEDAAHDAADDHLVDPHNIPKVDPNCTCTWNGSSCGVSGCKPNERLLTKVCTPLGCDAGYTCIPDNACCSVPRRTECYGPANPITNPAASIPSGYHLPCAYGDRIFQFDCGPNIGQQVCQLDNITTDGDRNCAAVCDLSGVPLDHHGNPVAYACPGSGNRLNQDMPVTLVDVCPLDSSGMCNYACNPGTTRSGTTCVSCGNGIIDPGEDCTWCVDAGFGLPHKVEVDCNSWGYAKYWSDHIPGATSIVSIDRMITWYSSSKKCGNACGSGTCTGPTFFLGCNVGFDNTTNPTQIWCNHGIRARFEVTYMGCPPPPPPPPPAAVCGNRTCEFWLAESCDTCVDDCGMCWSGGEGTPSDGAP